MNKAIFREIEGTSPGYYALLALLGSFIAAGLGASYYMEHHGHWVTGMNNQVVWGMPHVFAVFLIVAASGILNVASISSVFGKNAYKPLAPLSALLAMAFLIGGLVILVLDLGRPDRLIVAMTYYNFKSIFAWNIFLYTGFIAITGAYLLTMMERKLNPYSKKLGFLAFLWRLVLTAGTGSIFGFLVARQFYDTAIMAPMFIAMSFSFGLGVFVLVLLASYAWTARTLGPALVQRLRRLLGLFVAATAFLVLIFHLTSLYATERHGVEAFILAGDNVYSGLFWLGFVLLGTIVPLFLCFTGPFARSKAWFTLAAILVVAGGLSHLYVIIIGGQAFPLQMFPGYEVSSNFADGEIGRYAPTLPEVVLGLGGLALALAIATVAVKLLKFLPLSLDDATVDPHHREGSAADKG